MQCVAEGHVILHDFEFQTIMGVDVEEFIDIVEAWPEIDEKNEKVKSAINNSMNNLLGYPHGMHNKWSEVMDPSLQEIARIFRKWRGDHVDSYFDGME